MTDEANVADHLDEVVAAMADLTKTLESEPSQTEILRAVCAEAVRVVPGADLASITAIRDGIAETAASTDERANELDRVQYDLGEGPCLRAAESGEVVRVSIPKAGELWPEFVAAATERGIGSYLAAPLRVDDRLAGAVNLFGFGPHGFAETDDQLLQLYTAVVEFGLRVTRRYWDARKLAGQLDAAMQSRAVIEQAKGILMAVHKISDQEAIQRLITESQHTNTKLRDVAIRFVQSLSDG